MNDQSQNLTKDAAPRTQGEMLIAALLEFMDREPVAGAGLECSWLNDHTLEVITEDGLQPFVNLLRQSSYAMTFRKKTSQKVSDLLRYLRNNSLMSITSRNATTPGPRKGKTTYLFFLPPQNVSDDSTISERSGTVVSEDMATYLIHPSWYPEGPLIPGSSFYIERPGIDDRCKLTLAQPGALLRIKSPQLMGKTSLLFQLRAHAATKLNYRAIYINVAEVSHETLSGLDTFLKWLCDDLAAELKCEKEITSEWSKKMFSSSIKCSRCFANHFLDKTHTPLFLILDEVDRLFASPPWADDFFRLLRSWHDKSKSEPDNVWQRLRLAIAYSTEDYVPLDILVSPFNVGICFELKDFSSAQILQVAKQRGIPWTEDHIKRLMAVVGGHPYLIQLAAYYAKAESMSLEAILEHASTASGIYQDHLLSLLEALDAVPVMKSTFQSVVNSDNWIDLHPRELKQLTRLGVITQQQNQAKPRNALYQRYFKQHLR